MKKTKRSIWLGWMLPSSLLAAGVIPTLFCIGNISLLDKRGDIAIETIVFGVVLGLLIGLLQRILITLKPSVLIFSSWWWLLISAIIWSISSYIGASMSSEVSEFFATTEGSILFVVAVFIVSWPFIVWAIGLGLQGIFVALCLNYTSE